MEITEDMIIQPTKHSRLQEVDFNNLGFGNYMSDHRLMCNYANGEWSTPQITAFTNLSISPTTLALHYGQAVFEGLKAFRMDDGRINIFRIQKHYERLVKSLDRMCMVIVSDEIFTEGMHRLVELDKNWVPAQAGASLYIRPLVFASEAKFGVKVSEEYCFVVFSGPVAQTFQKPIKLKVETDYIRAAKGGTGYAKCAGNYGGAFYATHKAREAGYDQVLWTDARDHNYIEESGMMN